MIPLWVVITISAAFLQNLRGYLQKEFQTEHGTLAATYARFCFGLPFAAIYATTLWIATKPESSSEAEVSFWSLLSSDFFLFALMGGVAQIFATLWLVILYRHRHFAVGTALSKTETIQTFLIGLIILGESVKAMPLAGILISLVGVILLSVTQSLNLREVKTSTLLDRTTLLGIGAGAGFGISAVSYRAASLALQDGNVLLRAAITLMVVLFIQTLLMGLWLAWQNREALYSFWRSPRSAVLIGLVSVLGSIGWFTAMTIQNAALVRALGQIELLFSFATAQLIFHQHATKREIIGILLLIAGLLLIIIPEG